MQHVRLITSTVGLLLGCAILGVSLSAGNTMVQSAGTTFETSKKQFYINEALLPDHVAYPALMVVDRMKLEMDTPEERVYTQIEYARRRFEYAQALLEKGNTGLALTTVTKAEKYLINAAHDALKLEQGDAQRRFVYRTLVYYDADLQKLKPQFPDADRPMIEQLQRELMALQLQLETLVN